MRQILTDCTILIIFFPVPTVNDQTGEVTPSRLTPETVKYLLLVSMLQYCCRAQRLAVNKFVFCAPQNAIHLTSTKAALFFERPRTFFGKTTNTSKSTTFRLGFATFQTNLKVCIASARSSKNCRVFRMKAAWRYLSEEGKCPFAPSPHAGTLPPFGTQQSEAVYLILNTNILLYSKVYEYAYC